MTATLNDDTDQCYVCRRQPGPINGMCADCFSRAVWYINPPWDR